MLNNFSMLAVFNVRTLVYLQEMARNNLIPREVILFQEEPSLLDQKASSIKQEIIKFLDRTESSYQIIKTDSINNSIIVKAVRELKADIVIYSGPGGIILKPDFLNLGKRFLHIHAGRLPEYRGSTTVYYQILTDKTCSATALFLDSNIDSGSIVAIKEYHHPKGVDIDYTYDPKIRADLLVEIIKKYLQDKQIEAYEQNSDKGQTYYIMHPVLRHIARLKCDNEKVGARQ